MGGGFLRRFAEGAHSACTTTSFASTAFFDRVVNTRGSRTVSNATRTGVDPHPNASEWLRDKKSTRTTRQSALDHSVTIPASALDHSFRDSFRDILVAEAASRIVSGRVDRVDYGPNK